jgi:hypothetical protein
MVMSLISLHFHKLSIPFEVSQFVFDLALYPPLMQSVSGFEIFNLSEWEILYYSIIEKNIHILLLFFPESV